MRDGYVSGVAGLVGLENLALPPVDVDGVVLTAVETRASDPLLLAHHPVAGLGLEPPTDQTVPARLPLCRHGRMVEAPSFPPFRI